MFVLFARVLESFLGLVNFESGQAGSGGGWQ